MKIFCWTKPLKVAVLLTMLIPSLSSAETTYPCWINRLEVSDGKLRIYLLPSYFPRINIKRASKVVSDGQDKIDEKRSFTLGEGDKANMSDGLHSGCSLSVDRRTEGLGLQATAFVNLPSIPYSATTEFILPGDKDAIDPNK